jgi:hypothetical protein
MHLALCITLLPEGLSVVRFLRTTLIAIIFWIGLVESFMLLGGKRSRYKHGLIIKTIKGVLFRGKFVRKESRKNSTRERLQAYGDLGEKLGN